MISVNRLDFLAQMKTKASNEQLINIEVQKAEHPSDRRRLTKYLGK